MSAKIIKSLNEVPSELRDRYIQICEEQDEAMRVEMEGYKTPGAVGIVNDHYGMISGWRDSTGAPLIIEPRDIVYPDPNFIPSYVPAWRRSIAVGLRRLADWIIK